MFDAIIIGGSYAGMAAALQLARGRRDVLVLDAGLRRNRFASTSHGLLGQDGESPAVIADNAKAQLLKYPNVTWVEGSAAFAEKRESGFVVRTQGNESLDAKRLVLAVGVRDELPPVPGLVERWGKSVFHCPYCHGYELENGNLGVLATSEFSMHQALLIPEWGQTTFFTNGVFEPNEDQLQQLAARGVAVEPERVTQISGPRATVHLADGRIMALDGVFVASRTSPSGPLAEQLGCECATSPLGFFIQTNEFKETSVAGVFACGDVARPAGSVSLAIGDGAWTGTAVHRSLIFEGLS